MISPPIQGDALERVYSVNDLLDYDDFRSAVAKNKVKKICIIGGGLIGCEFTNDLINGGFEVEAVDPWAIACRPCCPRRPARRYRRRWRRRARNSISARWSPPSTKADNGVLVSLNNGATIAADIVVSAVGVRPVPDWPGRRASRPTGVSSPTACWKPAPNVYAMGDCAEVAGHVLVYVAPLMAAARALGKTLAGEPTEVSYPPCLSRSRPRPARLSWRRPLRGRGPMGHCGRWLQCQSRVSRPRWQAAGLCPDRRGHPEKMALQKELPAIMA